MSENEHHTLILTDANILIDYESCGIEVLALVSKYVAPMIVPDVVQQEVRTLTKEQIEKAGVTVVETPLALLAPAPLASKQLSTQDRVCLEMASANGWTCATNDKVLRNACQARGVRLAWGLELMVELVDRRVLPEKKAQNLGKKMHRVNPKSITNQVLTDFLARIHR
jgi:rRNA-processing protein FCF1